MDLSGKELWAKKEKDEYEYLDSIDVRRYLVDGADVWDIMDTIKDKFNDDYCKKYNDNYGLFNYTGTDDFLDYIRKRYPDISYHESIKYYIYNPDYKEG